MSVGAVSLPAAVAGATVSAGAVAGAAVSTGAVAVDGCAGASVEAEAAALPGSDAPLLTGGVRSNTGAELFTAGGFEWSLARVLLFFAVIVGTGLSTAGDAGVAVGATAAGTLGAGIGFVAGSAESAIGGGGDVSPAVATPLVAADGGCVAVLMAASFATCRFACTANIEAPTAQRAARPNPTTTLLVMFVCVSEYAMINLSRLVDDVFTLTPPVSAGCRPWAQTPLEVRLQETADTLRKRLTLQSASGAVGQGLQGHVTITPCLGNPIAIL